jgi:hypothetical protein
MTKCWKVEPAERPTFEDIYVSLQNMLMDNEVNTLILATVFQHFNRNKYVLYIIFDNMRTCNIIYIEK